MPNLLVAPLSPTSPANDPYREYEQGYYADGAYTAVPDLSPTGTGGNGIDEEDVDPQEAYYVSLCDRFAALSSALRLTPHILAASTTSSAFNPSSRASWRRFIVNMQPTSLILSHLRQEEVMHGLEVLETVLSTANLQRHKNIGLWAWGLLARCREVGQMSSEEVGVLRDLGKKAIAVLRGVTAGLYEDHSENGENEDRDEDRGEEEAERKANANVDADAHAHAHADAHADTHADAHANAHADAQTAAHADACADACADADADVDADANVHVSESPFSLKDSPASSLDDSSHLVEAAKEFLLKSLAVDSPEEVAITETRSLGSQPARVSKSERDSGLVEEQNIAESGSPIHTSGKQEDNEKSVKMHATLDMIITIVGELYGQKDLLPGRLLWDELESTHIGLEGA